MIYSWMAQETGPAPLPRLRCPHQIPLEAENPLELPVVPQQWSQLSWTDYNFQEEKQPNSKEDVYRET